MQVALGINLHFKELGMMESISDLSLSGLSSQMMSAGGKKKITLLEICKLMYYFLCIFIGLLFLEVPQWTYTP